MSQPSIHVKDATGQTVTIYSRNINGQAEMANSQPVVVASDQSDIPIVAKGHACEHNSSVIPLAGGASFTGQWFDLQDYGMLTISVVTDQPSIVDGLDIQWSHDGVTVHDHDKFTISANIAKTYTFGPAWRYARVVYTNGASAQSSFVLGTVARRVYAKPSSHRIEDQVVEQDDAELMKAVLTARIQNDGFVNIGATPSGNLKVTDAENGLAIAKGEVTGSSFVHKFGAAKDFDSADNKVTIWDGADDATVNQMRYVYSATADIDSISSSSAADTQLVNIRGLNAAGELTLLSVTLQGQTRVALPTPLWRVFQVCNQGTVDFAGLVCCYVNTPISAGVPIDTTKLRAMVNDGNNQTLMAMYTIPAGYTGYLRDWYATMIGTSKDVTAEVDLFARPQGKVFQLKHRSGIQTSGSSHMQHRYEEPEILPELTDIEIRASTDTSGSAVAAGFDIVLCAN